MEVSGIVLLAFAFSVFCGILYLSIAIAVQEKYTAHLKLLQNILHNIFIITNIPLGVLGVSLCAYDVLRHGESETGLLLCCVFFVLSFVLEFFLDRFFLKKEVYNPAPALEAPNFIFTSLKLLNNISEQKSILLSTINDYNNTLLTSIKNTKDNIDATAFFTRKYIKDEKHRNGILAENIKTCNNVFNRLNDTFVSIHEKTKSLNTKLSSSCTALVSVENQGTMLKDINLAFVKIFNEHSIEINKKIQRTLDSLNAVAYKYADFQNFPKPYKEIIDLYSVKIESILKILDHRKDVLLWEEYAKNGEAGVFVAPKQSIADLTEAIRLNPEYADSYYYRGMAYQYKTKPNYKAALKDYEKALELRPASNVFKKCIEKIKNDMRV